MNEMLIDSIETLEEFVFALGLHCVSVETIYETQKKVLGLNILDTDENEQVLTIAYEAKRLFHSMEALLHLIGERAEIDVNEVSRNLLHKLNKGPRTPQKLKPTRKPRKPRAKKQQPEE